MPFIAGLICLVCVILALPYLGKKGVLNVVLVMGVAILGFVFLWWRAIPVAVIFGIGFVAKKLFINPDHANNNPYIERAGEDKEREAAIREGEDYGPGI